LFLAFSELSIKTGMTDYTVVPDSKLEKLCILSPQYIYMFRLFVGFWRDSPQWARASSFTRLLDQTQRRTTVGRIPLNE